MSFRNPFRLTLLCLALAAGGAQAKVSPAEAARLDKELTPVGAERGANADGSIPAWIGGITTPPAGYKVGMHHPDPYADDKPLYVISAANLGEYQSLLSPGIQAMLKTYPSFKVHVYPTRRSASYPPAIYEALKANAVSAELVDDGNGFTQARLTSPFPIPQNGLEVIWNHLARYRGERLQHWLGQVSPTRDGDYTLVKMDEEAILPYSDPELSQQPGHRDIMLYFKQQVVSPARLAGTALLVHDPINQIRTPRQAWTYNTGQKRVRRAPNIAYDTPGTASDGLRTTDNFDMFNGSPDRYDWKLIGKQELLVPYNSYRLHSDSLKYKDIVRAGHINTDVVRYEKHRVWVLEANLKPGISHIYKRRVLFLDEDSWQILLADHYDNRDQLWRVSEAHVINYYEKPLFWSTLETFYDLQSGRYLAMGLDNEDPMYRFDAKLDPQDFTPQALRREGVR